MLNKMLSIGVLLLLSACSDKGAPASPAVADERVVERSAASEFDPDDTLQEQQAKAEARGAAQAEAAIRNDDTAQRNRTK